MYTINENIKPYKIPTLRSNTKEFDFRADNKDSFLSWITGLQVFLILVIFACHRKIKFKYIFVFKEKTRNIYKKCSNSPKLRTKIRSSR